MLKYFSINWYIYIYNTVNNNLIVYVYWSADKAQNLKLYFSFYTDNIFIIVNPFMWVLLWRYFFAVFWSCAIKLNLNNYIIRQEFRVVETDRVRVLTLELFQCSYIKIKRLACEKHCCTSRTENFIIHILFYRHSHYFLTTHLSLNTISFSIYRWKPSVLFSSLSADIFSLWTKSFATYFHNSLRCVIYDFMQGSSHTSCGKYSENI